MKVFFCVLNIASAGQEIYWGPKPWQPQGVCSDLIRSGGAGWRPEATKGRATTPSFNSHIRELCQCHPERLQHGEILCSMVCEMNYVSCFLFGEFCFSFHTCLLVARSQSIYSQYNYVFTFMCVLWLIRQVWERHCTTTTSWKMRNYLN